MKIKMNDLPEEIVYEILSYLMIDFIFDRYLRIKVLLVCKRWYDIGNQIFDPTICDNYALRVSCENGYLESVKFLLSDMRINPNYYDGVAIRSACSKGHTEIVKFLLKDPRINPSLMNNYALRTACQSGHTDIVKLLLRYQSDDPEKIIDPSVWSNDPILLASEYGHLEVIKLLIKDIRVDPSTNNNLPLRRAAVNGFYEIAKELLKDPRINTSDALIQASKFGHLEIVKLLLNDRRTTLTSGSALLEALTKNHINVVKLLLQDGRVEVMYQHEMSANDEVKKLLKEYKARRKTESVKRCRII